MKKIFILMLVSVLTVGMLSACQTEARDNGNTTSDAGKAATTATAGEEKTPAAEGNQNESITANKLSFEEITDTGTLSAEIAESIKTLGNTRGYAYFKLDDAFIVSVNSGERNTGGYSIKVKSVEDVKGITKITVEETTPGKDAIVTQALTYPKTVVKIKGAAGNFQVVDVNGGVFALLTVAGSTGQIDTEGVYSGQIDNNSIEISVNGEPGAFRIDDSFAAVIDSLKEKDKVSLSYYKNGYGQQILTRLEKK